MVNEMGGIVTSHLPSNDTRLLILDDDPAIGATITMMAQSDAVECRSTAEAESFYRELDAWSPTHIALDLVMPDHDGIEVLHELARRGCTATIIITSGVDSRVLDAARRSAEEHGLNIAGAIAKPFSLATLRDLLSKRTNQPGIRATPMSDQLMPAEMSPDQLNDAIKGRQLFVAFQPKVRCSNGHLAGFEGLVRWQHAEFGTIAPDRFIGVADRSGLSAQLNEAVFQSALAWFSQRSEKGLSLALNVSAASLNEVELADHLGELCERHAVNPAAIIIEVTESSAMGDQTAALDLLTRLRLKGFQLSIDDFGVGYSSLVQLARLPFSELKIDKSFVMSAIHSPESRTIIGAIVGLGRSLGLRTVAEGVEDLATFSFLKDIGCDLAQGYFIGRPMHGDALLHWLGEVPRQVSVSS
jgi:EAL domain-containing protein (putative c-di-GMP-specific phosphodiesterase class I)/ActR/RegA family two-component response regulator